MNNQLILGNIRITFLGTDIIRIERKYKGAFCDENTLFIPNRQALATNEQAYSINENVLCFGDFELYLPQDTLRGLRIEKNGKKVYTYKRLQNSGELPHPSKTPYVFALSDNPRIILPEGGYSAKRKGKYVIQQRVEDIYLLFADKDARKLCRLYVELTGRCEFVRLATLGSWNSKYYAYNEDEAKQVILDYEKYGVPLDNMVIDTDWRFSENGWGYDVDKRLFPDMKRFIDFAHSHNVEVMFNDHPQPVNGAHVFSPREIAYRERNLQALMKQGMDTWWYDRNWQTHLISPVKSLQCESLGMYLFHDVTENFYKKKAANDQIYRRPVIMGNVAEITNGEYNGISDSASHRYSIQWTGDIASDYSSLAQEISNVVRCLDNCIPYVNSDCGGHTGNPTKEEFIRWMQYGVLSPVFRPHCTKNVLRHREPWLYDEETLDIVREYNLLRYRLLPYIYQGAHEAYETGVGMFNSLSLLYPNDRRAVRYDEYMLGNNLLIAPVCGAMPEQLPTSCYTSPVEMTFYDGIEAEGEPIATATWNQLYFNLHHEPPIKGVPMYNFSARISTKIKVDTPKMLYVKSDDGVTVYVDGKCILEDNNTHAATLFALCELSPNVEHSVEIKYFQALGEAFLGLYISDVVKHDEKEIYLPQGKWMDVFDGKIYNGKRTITKKYGLACMPLFVRLGAILPLAEHAHNTKEQSWAKLVYDFYPDKASEDSGYLYEDDGETTAYKHGAFCKSNYSAKYCAEDNAFVLHFDAAKGAFEGDRFTREHEIMLKYHCLKGVDRVLRVSVNGQDVEFNKAKQSAVFPLSTVSSAPDASTVTVHFTMQQGKNYEVKFYLG